MQQINIMAYNHHKLADCNEMTQ